MRYLIGIFSCACKTEGVLCAETGQVLRYLSAAVSPEEMLQKLLSGMPEGEMAVWIGAKEQIAEEQMPGILPEKARVFYTTCAETILCAHGEPGEDGACLYMHLEAFAAAQRDGKTIDISGDAAPPFYRGGSYFAGSAAIEAALAAVRKTGKPTALVYMLEQAIGMPLAEGETFLKTAAPEKVASFARLVRRGVRAGDAVSIDIARRTLDALLGYVEEAATLFAESVLLYVFDVPEEDRATIKAAVESRFGEKFSVIFTAVPPVWGAVRGAAGKLGILPDKGFADLFRETYSICAE